MVTNIAWGSMHLHSRFSAKDALDPVETMVAAAAQKGWGAIGLTDHGNVAGIFDLYRSANASGLVPVPGCELYVTFDRNLKTQTRWHMGVLATTSKGWDNLIGLVNLAHRRFYYKPLLDFEDLMALGEQGLLDGLWATTGCFFGVAISPLHVERGLDPEVAYRLSANMVAMLGKVFSGRVLVELMNHRIEDETHSDTAVVEVMTSIADRVGLPCLVTSDSHYASVGSVGAHNTLKRLSSWSDDPDSALFPGEGFWVPGERYLCQVIGSEAWERGLEGFSALLEGYDLKVPEIDSFAVQMPELASVVVSPEADLRSRVAAAPGTRTKHELKRLDEELDVICSSGFASYILLAAEVTDFCRERGIAFMVRGSASGSLVCYLLGITQMNPLRWNLRFDRFLSRIRTNPPDIDIDVEHTRRDEVLAHLADTYAVCHIGTWREMSNERGEGDDDKGLLWVKWKSLQHKTGRDAPITSEEREALDELSAHRPYDGIGMNAAGILVVQDEAVLKRIPQHYISSSKSFVTMLDKNAVERLGYIKLDVLGLRTLTAVKQMETTTGMPMEAIPMSDQATMSMIRSGNTAGVFQLSGGAQKRGMSMLRPTKFEDIVIALALFRPAVMASGAMDVYISCRNGSPRFKHHRIIEEHVGSTYGVILFQEQVIGILRDLGMTPESLNTVLKAVKASNSAIGDASGKMEEVRASVIPLASAAGFVKADIDWLENALQAYAAYGFNRSHAVSYAFMAYRTAWYKRHYPTDFWAAMLSAYSGPKEVELRAAMSAAKVPVLPPHINRSKAGYSIDTKFDAVRSGLASIKGIGEKTAAEIAAHAPYESLEQFAATVSSRSVSGTKMLLQGHSPDACGGVVEILHRAGALRGIPMTTEDRLPMFETTMRGEQR